MGNGKEGIKKKWKLGKVFDWQISQSFFLSLFQFADPLICITMMLLVI